MAHVEKTIEIQKPVDQVYAQWTQFEDFPEFMENVEEVRQLDDKHLEWKAKIGGTERRWKAEIVEQRPNQVIAWRAIEGDRNDGKVEFQPVDGKTRVKLMLEYDPPGGAAGEIGDKLTQMTPGRVENDLKRFKKMIEERPQPTGKWEGEIRSGEVRK
ncbi:MAG TPA: SRPBCC family protein [Candidatus Limnocylindrales bacterium]|nr:SRPBCC family protein [Candidatus Limnocylindrales bacterium]